MPSSALRRSAPSPSTSSESRFQDSAFEDSQFVDPQLEPARPSRSSRRCPQCGGQLKRVLRTANDKRRWDADDYRRYRCRNDRCDWQGLLPVKHRGRRPRSRQQAIVDASPSVRLARAALLLALAGAVAWAGMQAVEFMGGL